MKSNRDKIAMLRRKMYSLYALGRTDEVIASECGVSTDEVFKWRKSVGLIPNRIVPEKDKRVKDISRTSSEVKIIKMSTKELQEWKDRLPPYLGQRKRGGA